MGANFDRWTILKLFEVASTLACVVFKSITDDEANRLALYLQKLSREWSLLNNVTWGSFGAAAANATYGGYLIITAALFVGRLTGELPTQKRITEMVLLGVGTILFIVLGSLEFAALDSVPEKLVDNAAVIGSLTLLTAALFLLDIGGPKAKKTAPQHVTPSGKSAETRITTQQVYEIEKDEQNEKKLLRSSEKTPEKPAKNGHVNSNGIKLEDVSGRYRDSQYGKYDIFNPSYVHSNDELTAEDRPPSNPGDPGYVQYTAQHWGEAVQKTPRQSPTQV